MYVIDRDTFRNCTPAALEEFPAIFTDVESRWLCVVIATLVSLYLFLALAIVCDEFFVPALERLSLKLDLSYDVAGATLMAAATSAPEFFVNIIGTFITKGDIGIGTIVGSSVFNTLAITAVCGTLSGVVIPLDWWPVTRELVWYIVAVSILTVVIADSKVFWYEALFLLAFFFINLAHLLSDRMLQAKFRHKANCCLPCFAPVRENVPAAVQRKESNLDEEVYDFWAYPQDENSTYDTFMWILSWPIELIFFFTIPNVRRDFSKEYCRLSMLMCIFWISVLSYLISWSITIVGFYIYVPDSVMGITFLAAGTSIPEAVSSLIVTRKGYGAMAVCNSLGSNTMDIFVCLGLPWLIKSLLLPNEPGNLYVQLNSAGLVYDCSSLLITALALYVAFMCTHFVLGKRVGFMCLFLYVVYMVIACMIELNYFGVVNLPTCTAEEL